MNHYVLRWDCSMAGFAPYQTVVFLQPEAGTMMAVMMVAILNVGHCDINTSNSTFSLIPALPLSFNLFSTGILLGSCTGSGWSRSQLVWTRNQVESLSSQEACRLSVSRSSTVPSFGSIPETMKQTGPPILSVFNLLTAAVQLVSSASTLLKSQRVGIALFFSTLIRSSVKCFAYLVSQLAAKAPCLIPVKAKTLPTTISLLNNRCSPLQQSILVNNFASSSHISKSRFLPWITFPQGVLTSSPVQAAKVEYSYMKLRKKIFSKGRLLRVATASTSFTKS